MSTSSDSTTVGSAAPLTVRRLLVDLKAGFGRHWNGGDAFRTAYANALSMSFPVGEQFFIDSVRNGIKHLPEEPRWQTLRELAKGFIGQESTHRHLHGLYNDHLTEQGLFNHWAVRAQRRIDGARAWRQRRGSRAAHLHELAITAALEHYTSVFGDFVLRDEGRSSDLFAGAEPTMQTLWRWHASEETEHKSVAFDLYQALGGAHKPRVWWFVYVSLVFFSDTARQTANNLWRDGSWWWPSTWWSATRFLFGWRGLVWRSIGPTLSYFRRDFHPEQVGDPSLAANWLSAHARQWQAVRG